VLEDISVKTAFFSFEPCLSLYNSFLGEQLLGFHRSWGPGHVLSHAAGGKQREGLAPSGQKLQQITSPCWTVFGKGVQSGKILLVVFLVVEQNVGRVLVISGFFLFLASFPRLSEHL